MVECVWVKGVVIIFKKYNFFKAKITSSKSNNTCFLLKKKPPHLLSKHTISVFTLFEADLFILFFPRTKKYEPLEYK